MSNFKCFLLVCVCIVLSVASCKKEKSKVIIQGFVMDEKSGRGIAGTKVDLYERAYPANSGTETYVESQTTNQEGFYTFEFIAPPTGNFDSYILRLNIPRYFAQQEFRISTGSITLNLPYVYNIMMTPEAFLKVNIKNTAPVNSFDKIEFTLPGTPIIHVDDTLSGTDVDAWALNKIAGHEYAVIPYFVTKSGNRISYIDSIYCPPFDTTSYLLYY